MNDSYFTHFICRANNQVILEQTVDANQPIVIDVEVLMALKHQFETKLHHYQVQQIAKNANAFAQDLSTLPLRRQFVVAMKCVVWPLFKRLLSKIQSNQKGYFS